MGIDCTPEEGSQDEEFIDDGTYVVVALKVTLKPTNDNTGEYFKFDIQVLSEGRFKNWWIWPMYNVKNESAKCVAIGKTQLGKFAAAIGMDPKNVEPNEMLRKPFQATIGFKKGKNGYPGQNVINDYKALAGNQNTRPAAPQKSMEYGEQPVTQGEYRRESRPQDEYNKQQDYNQQALDNKHENHRPNSENGSTWS